jgi:hypothetical protein
MLQTQTVFVQDLGLPQGAVAVNRRAWFQNLDGYRAVFADQAAFYCYPLADLRAYEIETRLYEMLGATFNWTVADFVRPALAPTPRTDTPPLTLNHSFTDTPVCLGLNVRLAKRWDRHGC